jgi:TonB family protein
VTGRDAVAEAAERLRRREEAGRWLITASLSLLIHIAVLLVLASSLLDVSPPVEAEPEETVVPLELEQEPPAPEPQPEPRQTPAPEPEEQPAEQEPPEDQELIGWKSQGEEPGRQERPPGPETAVHAPPEPSEQQGTELDPSELEEAPEGPDELASEPGQSQPEEATGPAEEAPELLDDTPVDEVEQPEEQAPPEEPEEAAPQPQPPGELFPAPQDVPPPEPDAPRQQSETQREPEPEPLPLPTPRPRRPEREPDRGGARQQLPGIEAEIQGGYFNQNLKFDSNDYRWSEYATKLYFAVYRAWLRELHGRVRRFERDQTLQGLSSLDGNVSIHFTIHRDGGVSRLQVRNPSRLPALDAASEAALRRAVIPPLPDDFPRDQEGVTFGFELRGFRSAQQLERQLEWSRSKGEF